LEKIKILNTLRKDIFFRLSELDKLEEFVDKLKEVLRQTGIDLSIKIKKEKRRFCSYVDHKEGIGGGLTTDNLSFICWWEEVFIIENREEILEKLLTTLKREVEGKIDFKDKEELKFSKILTRYSDFDVEEALEESSFVSSKISELLEKYSMKVGNLQLNSELISRIMKEIFRERKIDLKEINYDYIEKMERELREVRRKEIKEKVGKEVLEILKCNNILFNKLFEKEDVLEQYLLFLLYEFKRDLIFNKNYSFREKEKFLKNKLEELAKEVFTEEPKIDIFFDFKNKKIKYYIKVKFGKDGEVNFSEIDKKGKEAEQILELIEDLRKEGKKAWEFLTSVRFTIDQLVSYYIKDDIVAEQILEEEKEEVEKVKCSLRKLREIIRRGYKKLKENGAIEREEDSVLVLEKDGRKIKFLKEWIS
jgi:hypothetical protein